MPGGGEACGGSAVGAATADCDTVGTTGEGLDGAGKVANPGDDGCGDGEGLLGVGEVRGARLGSTDRTGDGDGDGDGNGNGDGDGDGDGAGLGAGFRTGSRRGVGLGEADGVALGEAAGEGDEVGDGELCAAAVPTGRTTASSRTTTSAARPVRLARRRPVPSPTPGSGSWTRAGIRRS